MSIRNRIIAGGTVGLLVTGAVIAAPLSATAAPEDIIPFDDPQVVDHLVMSGYDISGDGQISEEEGSYITSLDFSFPVTSLNGFDHLTGLTSLTLRGGSFDSAHLGYLNNLNIQTLNLSDLPNVSTLDHLSNAPIGSLVLNNVGGSSFDISNLLMFTHVLTQLEVSNTNINSWEWLDYSTQLTSLTLDNVGLTSSAASAIGWMPSLERLNVMNNPIDNTNWLNGAIGGSLYSLNLVGNQISDLYLPSNINASYIDASYNHITYVHGAPGSDVEELYLNNNNLTDTSDISFSSSLGNLILLNLSDNNITGDDQFSAIASFAPSLQALGFDNNGLTGLGGVTNLADLYYLGVAGNAITDLSAVVNHPTLTEIVADQNHITDLSPIGTLPSFMASWSSFADQYTVVSEVNAGEEVTNPVRDAGSNYVPLTAVTGDLSYDPATHRYKWEDVPGGGASGTGTASWDAPSYNFSGILTQDVNEPPLVFADSALQQCLVNAVVSLNGSTAIAGRVTQSEINEITTLDCAGMNITSLDGMEAFNGGKLASLNLAMNRITSLAPIGGITTLTNLQVNDNNLTNGSLNDIAGLVNLTLLNASDNNLTSAGIAPLAAGFVNLSELYLHNTGLDNLSALAGANLPALTTIGLSENLLTSLDTLAEFTTLNIVFADSNNINSVAALSTLTALTNISLSNNVLTSLEGLSSPVLSTLTAENNYIVDVDALLGLPLNVLNLTNNAVENVDGLAGMTTLNELFLGTNQLDTAAIAPLGTLAGLYSLNLNHNHIDDITVLGALSDLENLNVVNNHISDFSVLDVLTNLYWVGATGQTIDSGEVEVGEAVAHNLRGYIGSTLNIVPLTGVEYDSTAGTFTFEEEDDYTIAWSFTSSSDFEISGTLLYSALAETDDNGNGGGNGNGDGDTGGGNGNGDGNNSGNTGDSDTTRSGREETNWFLLMVLALTAGAAGVGVIRFSGRYQAETVAN